MKLTYTEIVSGRVVMVEAHYEPRCDDVRAPRPAEAFLLAVIFGGRDIRVALAMQHPEEYRRLRLQCLDRCLLEMATRAGEPAELRAWGGR